MGNTLLFNTIIALLFTHWENLCRTALIRYNRKSSCKSGSGECLTVLYLFMNVVKKNKSLHMAHNIS